MKNLLLYVKDASLWNYFSIHPFRSFAKKGVTISGPSVWAALCFLIINATAVAQGTISTHAVYPDNNGSSAVSFEIESTSPVNITDISHVFNTTTSSSEVWIRIGGVGSPNSAGDLEVTAANGWVLDQTATVSGGGGANSAPVSLQNLTEIAIPANTPVGVVITGGMRYSGSNTAPPTPTVFTDGPVTLRTGGTWGYGGAMSTLTNSPRGFLGTVTYELGVKGNCANSFTNFVIDSISGTSAKISWSPGTGNSSFYLEYGATGFTPGTGTKVTGAYPGAQPPVVLNGLTPSTNYDIYFGEICNSGSDSVYFPTPQQFSTSKSCSPVLNFSASNLTSSSADLSWTHASAASDFDIIYGAPGFDPANAGTTVNTTSSPYTLSSLSGNTDYDAYIVADCGGANGMSDTTGPLAIKTLCGAYTAPYFNDFENDALDVPPGCWTDYVTGTSAFVEVEDFTGAAAPYAGSQALYLYSGSSSTTPGTDTLIAISPQFSDLPAGDKQIRFYANSDDPLDQLIIGTIPALSPSASFTPIDTITFNTPDTYQEVILPLTTANGYNGTDEYIVFMHNLGVTTDYIRIDDFNYEVIPACPKVSNISLTGIGVTDASFTFSGSGTSYDVEFGPTGFTQGTGCVGTFSSNNITIDNSTSAGCATQLGGNTTYDIYIRNNCTSSSNGSSIWEGPFTFTTLCAPFTAPYFNDFESEALDVPPSCWESYVTASTGFVEVEDFTGTAAPYSGSQALYIYSGNGTPSGDTVVAISPQFSDLTAGDKRIRFFANSDDPVSQLYIGTLSSATPGGSFTPMDTITFPTPDTYQEVIVNFETTNGYNGTDEYIAFVHSLGATIDYVRIDDFNYETIPPCVGPSAATLGAYALTANGASLYWGANGGGIKTYVEVGSIGFTPGTSSFVVLDSITGSDDTITVTGLSSQTDYEFYVQDSCALGGKSRWVGPFSFTTPCGALTTPHTESFDNSTIPNCWTTYSSSNETWTFGTNTYAPSADHTGNNGEYATVDDSESPASSDVTLESPLFDVTNLVNPELEFFLASTDATVTLTVDVWDGTSWNTGVFTHTAATTNTWDEISVDLTPYAGSGNVAVRFVVDENNGTFQNDLAIDDVSIQSGPTCPDPTALGITGLTDTEVTLYWNGIPAHNNNYQVWFGPQGFYQGSQTLGGVKGLVSNDSLLVDTLSEQTCYEFAVRAICGPGDSSMWVGAFSFCTECTNQLSGTYTVGGPAGPTNFATLDSVATELNGCGVSGPVIFNIAPGTYSENITLTNISGASATNTVTFNGGDTSLVEITHTSTTDEPTIHFNGADYVTFKNVTVSNNSTSDAWGFMFQNGSDNNTVDSCHIKMPVTTTFEIMGIVASASLSSATSVGNNANNLTVSNCMITGGETGIHLEGATTAASYNAGNQILNNIFRFQDDHGIEVDGQIGLQIIGNDLDSLVNVQADGITLQNIDDFVVSENRVIAPDWALYITDGNDGFTPSANSQIVNNMIVSSTDYGIYLNDFESTDVFHNSVVGEPALLINDQSNAVAIKNNIFYSTGDYAFESSDALNASDDIDYNLYYSAGTDAFEILSTVYTDLAAWQAGDASRNVNSLEGDPVFVDPVFDLHALSNLPNNVADGSVGVTTDIDGDPRSATTPDMGADEFVPVSGDLALINGEFIKGLCLGTNDSVMIQIENLIGSSVNFAIDPLTVTYDVTGAATSSGTIVVNTGTLPTGDTITVYGTGIDLSIPGNYTLSVYIDPNAVNTLAFNDTLIPAVDFEVDSNLTVSPKNVTLLTSTDSVEICATSAFFGGGNGFFISEISHYYNGGSNPGTKPSYLTSDDYIEVTGVPGSDMEGITLEIYRGTGGTLLKSFTFPAGTVIGPNGTAIIMTGQTGKVSEPANFLYDGRGGNTTTMGSGDDAGYILREGSTIIDAVTYDAYTFDASTGVTAADWTGQVTGTSGTAGMRLIADDNNTAANWAVVTTAAPQDAQVLNSGVTLPAPPATTGFMWSLNGVPVDTASCTFAGPHTVGGTYNYVATYTNGCGTFTDTVVVTVPNCFSPTSFEGGSTSTSSVFVKWDTTALGSATYEVEYGNIGFALGTGTNVALAATDSTEITGIATNVCYEYYVRAVCSSSSQSPWVGPIRICPEADPCDQLDQYSTGLVDNGESALFIGWQGNGGDGAFSSTRSQSASNSLWIHDGGTNAASDVVAYFDTISTGAWSIDFSLFVESGSGAYYNIQQNHDPTGTDNQWAGDVYFDTSGTAHVEIDAANTIAGTFAYTQGQWIDMRTVIDLDNDTVWVEYNGSSTGIGWAYSNYNPNEDLQFNGINFYSGVLTGQTYDIDYYMDDFCVNPYIYASCLVPGQLAASNEGCDSVGVSWNSNSGNQSSIIEYGPTGFTPGSGTYVSFVNSPQIISGLTPGTTYEFYVADTCGTTDTSAWAGPISFTTLTGPLPVASFTYTVNGFVVDFNAGASTGGTSYDWDFGDGNNGTGVSTNHTYTAGGTQTVTLTVTNGCGTDDTTIVISSISVFENALGQSLEIYPNPTRGEVNVSFDAFDSEEVVIRILDVSGKQIMSQTDNNANGKMSYKLDISQLADGVYMLEVSAGTLKTNKRLIKR